MGEQRTLFGPPEGNNVMRGADLSSCGLYRYRLWRRWNAAPAAVFIMLNPSTADAFADDATIRRCIGFAQSWIGHGAIEVVNLFAWRARNPEDLSREQLTGTDIVGPENDRYVREVLSRARSVIAAWGVRGSLLKRDRAMVELVRATGVGLSCLRTTKDGHPEHPLYLPANLRPRPFEVLE